MRRYMTTCFFREIFLYIDGICGNVDKAVSLGSSNHCGEIISAE
jgi:hypothetical protein